MRGTTTATILEGSLLGVLEPSRQTDTTCCTTVCALSIFLLLHTTRGEMNVLHSIWCRISACTHCLQLLPAVMLCVSLERCSIQSIHCRDTSVVGVYCCKLRRCHFVFPTPHPAYQLWHNDDLSNPTIFTIIMLSWDNIHIEWANRTNRTTSTFCFLVVCSFSSSNDEFLVHINSPIIGCSRAHTNPIALYYQKQIGIFNHPFSTSGHFTKSSKIPCSVNSGTLYHDIHHWHILSHSQMSLAWFNFPTVAHFIHLLIFISHVLLLSSHSSPHSSFTTGNTPYTNIRYFKHNQYSLKNQYKASL